MKPTPEERQRILDACDVADLRLDLADAVKSRDWWRTATFIVGLLAIVWHMVAA